MLHSQAQQEFKFDWTGPTASPVSNAWKMPAPMAFAWKANEIRRTNRICGPPFNPYDYADALGVIVEEVEGLPIDGLLKQTKSGKFVIRLKREVCQSRKNFTLAHELAHTFFYDALMTCSPKFRGSFTADPEEEALCNIGARELLMPRQIFQDDLKTHHQNGLITARTLLQLASLYQVSLQAVAIRLTTICKEIACVMWEKSGCAINVKWVAPIRRGKLILCQTGRSSVELAFKGPPNAQIIANDSFYCKGRRMIRREALSQKFSTGSVFSILGQKSRPEKSIKDVSRQAEPLEQWWQR